MAKTRHIEKRMNQRGIQASMLDTVEKFGVWNGDKLVLNRKGALAVIKELDQLRKNLIQVEGKGGIALVQVGGVDITAYGLDSYKRGRMH